MKGKNYANGKIYKIISEKTDKVYIGSTCSPLHKRFYEHRNSFWRVQNGEKNRGNNFLNSFELMKFEDAIIVLVEEYPCNSLDELKIREAYWIQNTKNAISSQEKKESIVCTCGAYMSRKCIKKHIQTNIHKQFELNNIIKIHTALRKQHNKLVKKILLK